MNNKLYKMDAAPFVERGRIFIPVRYLARALGVSDKGVTWHAKAQTVEIATADKKIRFMVNKNVFYLNDQQRQMDAAPLMINSRVFAPCRPLAEAFGYAAGWDEETKAVLVGPPGRLPAAGSLPPVKAPAAVKPCRIPANGLPAERLAAYRKIYFSNHTGEKANVYNAGIAAGYVSGTSLAPGGEFSFNRVVGKRTTQKGFIAGKDIWNHTVIGGGVCRMSTVLFQVARAGGLTVTERHPHARPVHYTPPGTDATVSWGREDLRFKNNRPLPLVIYAGIAGRGDGRDLWAGLWEQKPLKRVVTAILIDKPGLNLWQNVEKTHFDATLDSGYTFVSLDQMAGLYRFSCELEEYEGIMTASVKINNRLIKIKEGSRTIEGADFALSETPFRLAGSDCRFWLPLRDWVRLAGGEAVWVGRPAPVVLLNLSGVPVAGRPELK